MAKVSDLLVFSNGVRGSYQKWQRKPPAHSVYQISFDDGTATMAKVYAENRVLDDADHPTIQAIEEETHKLRSGHTPWNDLSDEHQAAARDELREDVKDRDFFRDD